MRGVALSLLIGAALPAASQWAVAEEPNATGNPGWWEEPVDASACGAGWAAVWDVYDSAGVRRPWIWHVGDGVDSWEELLGGEEGAAAGVAACGEGVVWAATRFGVSDSLGLAAYGVVGGCLPQQDWGFLSTYSELRGIAVDGERVAVVGMSLDPCCLHRELPVLAVMGVDGALDTGFAGGMVAVDVAGPTLVDTLGAAGPLPQHGRPLGGQRHEDGGVFQAVAFDGDAVVAGGAYANAFHYEVMVVRFAANGSLDEEFGDAGMVRLNVDPGNNAWVESLAVLPNGQVQCLVRAHDAGDLEPAFHVLTLDASGQIQSLSSSPGSPDLLAKGMQWGAGAWTAWGVNASGAVVGRWQAGGNVTSENLPESTDWQTARGAWNGETMASFGRATSASGEAVARMRAWHPDPSHVVASLPAPRAACAGIHPQPCPAGTLPTLPFPSATWYDLRGRRLESAPTATGWHLVRSTSGTTCPVIFQ